MKTLLFLVYLICIASPGYARNTQPEFSLAKTYAGKADLSDYWVSEKLDGVRAYWDGKQLISRQGNIFPAPHWFTKDFPTQPLDGELWLGRGQFQQLMSVVSKKQAIDSEWQKIGYYVFDLPQVKQSFTQRSKNLQQLVKNINSPYLHRVKQYRIANHSALEKHLKDIVKQGGEGLMLHRGEATNRKGRTKDLLKVKPYYDAEATVIAHTEGKGKFEGLLGAIVVETPKGKQFRIGTGFSMGQRRSPPSIGSQITYTYHGKTDAGIPRFASFLRTRKD
ncbi:MAG: DNA ligase [Methylococcaceae bacterium]|nr:DNA ligase [Methylococcaceae bacterium]